MHSVYLLLGSNLGHRETYLDSARKFIEKQVGVITKMSSLYETAAWGNTLLPSFINQVVKVDTLLPANEVMKEAIRIETETGRVREEKWGSRVIDIDLLFFDHEVINETHLTVPHPRLHLRKFTLLPFAEIEPSYLHPVLNKTISQILEELTDPLPVVRLN